MEGKLRTIIVNKVSALTSKTCPASYHCPHPITESEPFPSSLTVDLHGLPASIPVPLCSVPQATLVTALTLLNSGYPNTLRMKSKRHTYKIVPLFLFWHISYHCPAAQSTPGIMDSLLF